MAGVVDVRAGVAVLVSGTPRGLLEVGSGPPVSPRHARHSNACVPFQLKRGVRWSALWLTSPAASSTDCIACCGWPLPPADSRAVAISRRCRAFPRLSWQRYSRAWSGPASCARHRAFAAATASRAPAAITVPDVVVAIEGSKPLFECREIRAGRALFGDAASPWATAGVCAIHATMLRAERAMRDSLAAETLADIADTVARKAPACFRGEVREWLAARSAARVAARDK